MYKHTYVYVCTYNACYAYKKFITYKEPKTNSIKGTKK